MMKKKVETKEKGITLVALVVTIVVLLILAGITINYVMGDNSVFSKAQQAKLEYQIAQAREKLEITFGNAQILKHTDTKYNQDDYLDDLMKSEISNIKIKDDIVIVDDFAFEIDRSVPKIGQYLGKEEDLVFPEINATVTLAENNKAATIHIIAKEDTNGISKIEVIQGGCVLETYECENSKEEITKDFIAKQNGVYTIKVYAGLTASEKVIVDGIIASVEYSPNGDENYKKEHQVKVTVKETEEKVKSIKCQWLNTTVEPTSDTFTESCENGETLTKNGVTGSYYLWTLLETENGNTRIERSEAFYFDNQGPTVTLTSIPVSATSFTLTATANDAHSGLKECKFYVNGELKSTEDISSGTASYTATEMNTGNTSCYVIVIDNLGNEAKQTVIGKTKIYSWYRYTTIDKYSVEKTLQEKGREEILLGGTNSIIYTTGEPKPSATADGKMVKPSWNKDTNCDKHNGHWIRMNGVEDSKYGWFTALHVTSSRYLGIVIWRTDVL